MTSSLPLPPPDSAAPRSSPSRLMRRPSPWLARLPVPGQKFLAQLIELGLVPHEALHPFLDERADRLAEYVGEIEIGQALIEAGLLTAFQLDRVLAGQTHGLILGNYLVLDQIGSGGMGLVYLGEHRLMKRRVAIKVLPVDDDLDLSVKQRFYAEMRLLAELQHPTIVQAFDAGELESRGPNMPLLTYLVMEYIAGGDLEQHVERHGPPNVSQACEWARQAALGLQAAHDLHVVHRDIKPSNLLLSSTQQIKIVDFGLAHQFCNQLTDPRALLGSVEFMAPEQSHDPSGVGPEADVYGLAATFFWVLTGEAPYPFAANIGSALRSLQYDEPRRLSELRPDLPPELDNLFAAMLQREPSRRPTPLAVSTTLAPLTIPPHKSVARSLPPGARELLQGQRPKETPRRRVLLLDGDPRIRKWLRSSIESLNCLCVEAGDAGAALDALRREPIDLVLVNLPDVESLALAVRLREASPVPYLKILVIPPEGSQADMPRGIDDYLVRPFDLRQLKARVEQGLRVKEEQDRTRALAEQFQKATRQLEQSLEASKTDLRQAHDAMLFAMAKMAESQDGETSGHLRRLQRYVVALAKEAARQRPWSGLVDGRFLSQLERCVVLHDIGKIGLPDDILQKPASLTTAERELVKQHPLIGDRILEGLAQEHGTSLDFLVMARGIVRHHHERFDGDGYPDGLIGDAIPPAARLTALADVYDALRRERLHKPALPHSRAVSMIMQAEGQFDPTLLLAFAVCQDEFERIFREVGD